MTPPQMTPIVYLDFETYYDAKCSVKTLGPKAYTRHPKFHAYLVAICTVDPAGGAVLEYVGDPRLVNWVKYKNHIAVAHNAMFDAEVFGWLCDNWDAPGGHHPFHPRRDLFPAWHCSASLAAFLGLPRSLGAAIEAAYGVKLDKGMRDWMKGKTWADCVAAGKADKMKTYGGNDALWGCRLYTGQIEQMSQLEQFLMWHTILAGLRGIKLDLDYVEQSISTLQRIRDEIEISLPWMAEDPEASPTSPKSLAVACRAAGILPPTSTAETSPAFEKWQEENADVSWVKDMQRWRKTNKTIKMLEVLRTRETDGYFHPSIKYYGAHTGRWSGDGGFNMHGMPKEAREEVDLRGCFIPNPGYKLAIGDLSQIEARVLPWLAGDWKLMELIRSGFNVYEAHAAATMNWKGEPGTMSEQFPTMYSLAKARVLALGFGCGHEKFVGAAWAMAKCRVDPKDAARIVAEYRGSNPKIPELWRHLDLQFKQACDRRTNPTGEFEIELPSGRVLKYWNCKQHMGQYMAEPVLGGLAHHFYGGKLTENLVQAVARDIIGAAIERIETAGYWVLMSIHDEVVVEVPEGSDGSEIKALVEIVPEWAEGLPIKCKVKVADRYKKF